MGEPFGWEDFRRQSGVPPDQDQRLRQHEHGVAPHRRTRAWIVVAVAVALVAAFVAIVASGGGADSLDGALDGAVVTDRPI